MIEFRFKNTICICLLLLLSAQSKAQVEKPYKDPGGLNNWFVEVGGAAFFYSLNYEKILARSEKVGWQARVGLGYFPINYTLLNKVYLDKETLMTPFTTSISYGGGKEKLELGGGFTMFSKDLTNREIVLT